MQPTYRVLGPGRARRADGTEGPVRGARLAALFAALAAAGGRPVGAAALAARVWADDTTAPEDPGAALQALVARLRRTLGAGAVGSAPGGYRLAAAAEDIDLFRFERLAAEGAAALAAGEPERAAALLDEALGLWAGPALADLPDRAADPLVVRVERRHAEARRDRLAADVARGRAAAALAPLTALAGAHPLDEPLQALRIRALRDAGRAAEALAAYEEVRRTLADRLGADPGPELRALHERLLSGEGPEAPGRRAPSLPARLTSFIGRDEELAALSGELTSSRLVTLLGHGGVGKTRLALEAAEAYEGDGTVHLAELASVREESEVPGAVLTALGARETMLRGSDGLLGGDPLSRLVEHCAGRRMLLILDNCEHVVGAAARLAEVVLARCPGVRVLATSREPLGVPGERSRPLGPLPEAAALRLLGERGAAARPGFEVAGDLVSAREIVRRLDGLPLAIELAAARVRVLSPRQIADRLDDRFRLLTSGARTVLPRQQTLRAVVDWSWDLLEEPERAALRRLAVFTGGCDLEAAEAVCAGPEGADVLDVLAALVDKSLVVSAPGERGMRFRLLETVGEYAAERLDEAGERAEAERAHLTHYRELARTRDPALRGPGQAAALALFEREHDNLRTALRTALAAGDEQEVLCLVHSLAWFWQLRNHQNDSRTWTAAAGRLGPDPFEPPVRPAEPLPGRCHDVPPPWTGERLREARRGARLYALAAQGGSGATAMEQDAEARERLHRVVAAYRPGLPQTCRQPGTVWFFARLMTGGLTGLDTTLALLVTACRAHGDPWDLAFALLMRAKLAGRGPEEAAEALALFEEARDAWGIAESLAARGEAYERAGRLTEAAEDFGRAADAAGEAGARSQVPVFTARLAAVRLRLRPDGDEEAERLLADAAEEAARWGAEAAGSGRLLLAQHYAHTGRTGLAQEQLGRAETEFGDHTPALFWGLVGGMRAWIDCLDGAHDRALARLGRAVDDLETLAHMVAPYLLVAQLATGAWALGGRGRPGDARTAARLLGAYDAQDGGGPGGGFRPYTPRTEALIREGAEAAARAALTPEEYADGYAAGRALPVTAAAALLRRAAEGAGPAPGARMRGAGPDTRMASAGTHPQKHGGDGMNAEPDEKSRGDVPTPDRLLHSGSEGEFTAEDVVLASGRDVTPQTLAWAERRMAEKGRASLDELLP
ncbi:ATP-binding protein [Streptomyces hydrogenans]|uniref:ATP-binding protein n=1 Tax=Streptomyces hydrogenans TaxID=1873719 RepID=UPI001CFE2414|nr:BTAD domain-containing putative transcriptional regulator [Streptomyces hydrogenans]